MTIDDFTTLSIADLYEALRSGRITAIGIAERAIENYARHGEAFSAYKTWDAERFRAQATAADAALAAELDFGPLQGLPISIKDLYGVAGYPTYAGSPKPLPDKWQREGPVVRTLRRGLASIPGKTNTVEFAFGGVGTNVHWGAPFNPWDAERHRAPGGSSAGAGVSLWAGTAVLALGSDTAGSVRVPASVTGTVGVKTSMFRWSVEGIVPLSPSLDTPGLLARSAADAAIGFAVIDPLVEEPPLAFLASLSETELSDLTIGVADWFFRDCEPGIAESVRTALAELNTEGAKVTAVEMPEIEESMSIFRRGGLAAPEFATFINGEMSAWKDTLDPNVAARFDRMEAITAVDYLARRQRLEKLSASAAERFREIDVLVGPTVAITPPDIALLTTREAYHQKNMGMLRNTAPVNLLRLCGVTIPVALDPEGMPVGLQIIAPFGEDERALAVAVACERVLGTARERLGIPPRCRA